MRASDLARFTLVLWVGVVSLAGCGGASGSPLSASPADSCFACAHHDVAALRLASPERMPTLRAYGVLYRFKGAPGDGRRPWAPLVDVNGLLYGTTESGGAYNDGTVFSITPSGSESVLYSFAGSPGDGAGPLAGLVNVNGTLYGTTSAGGANGDGTVFSITPSDTEAVLHSFAGSGDGAHPYASLLNVNGTLYGTTCGGNSAGCDSGDGCGTVFKITTSGVEAVLHLFDSSSGDGCNPYAGLIKVKGTLYGTTFDGGANNDGTVFSITPSDKETLLHSFAGAPGDGGLPWAPLVNVNGTLYGTTYYGGRCSIGRGCGTVFSTTPSGTETVLHSFKGRSKDGSKPIAGLINFKGKLYGTTFGGGRGSAGTVFSITPSGSETVLHYFVSGKEGLAPSAGLIDVGGTLYGTAAYGGLYVDGGYTGTVFSFSP
jgi:uncharacterized repeat protein (TIGR03803 family)